MRLSSASLYPSVHSVRGRSIAPGCCRPHPRRSCGLSLLSFVVLGRLAQYLLSTRRARTAHPQPLLQAVFAEQVATRHLHDACAHVKLVVTHRTYLGAAASALTFVQHRAAHGESRQRRDSLGRCRWRAIPVGVVLGNAIDDIVHAHAERVITQVAVGLHAQQVLHKLAHDGEKVGAGVTLPGPLVGAARRAARFGSVGGAGRGRSGSRSGEAGRGHSQLHLNGCGGVAGVAVVGGGLAGTRLRIGGVGGGGVGGDGERGAGGIGHDHVTVCERSGDGALTDRAVAVGGGGGPGASIPGAAVCRKVRKSSDTYRCSGSGSGTTPNAGTALPPPLPPIGPRSPDAPALDVVDASQRVTRLSSRTHSNSGASQSDSSLTVGLDGSLWIMAHLQRAYTSPVMAHGTERVATAKAQRRERERAALLEQLSHDQSDTAARTIYVPLLERCEAAYEAAQERWEAVRGTAAADTTSAKAELRQRRGESAARADLAWRVARFNLGWALVHQQVRTRRVLVEQGVQLLSQLREELPSGEAAADTLAANMTAECRYFAALGRVHLQDWCGAREELLQLLEEQRQRRHLYRQARLLLEVVDERIRRDGWIGLGVTAALFGMVGTALIGGVLAWRASRNRQGGGKRVFSARPATPSPTGVCSTVQTNLRHLTCPGAVTSSRTGKQRGNYCREGLPHAKPRRGRSLPHLTRGARDSKQRCDTARRTRRSPDTACALKSTSVRASEGCTVQHLGVLDVVSRVITVPETGIAFGHDISQSPAFTSPPSLLSSRLKGGLEIGLARRFADGRMTERNHPHHRQQRREGGAGAGQPQHHQREHQNDAALGAVVNGEALAQRHPRIRVQHEQVCVQRKDGQRAQNAQRRHQHHKHHQHREHRGVVVGVVLQVLADALAQLRHLWFVHRRSVEKLCPRARLGPQVAKARPHIPRGRQPL
eukprot:ctg_843.g206